MSWRDWVYELQNRPFTVATVVSVIYRAVAAMNVALGSAILAGGKTRFPFPTYQPLLDLSSGLVWPWGVSIALAGGLMLVPYVYANLLGLAVAFLWMNMFSAMFVVALVKYPEAGSTAPIPYAAIAIVQVALLTLKVVESRTEDEE